MRPTRIVPTLVIGVAAASWLTTRGPALRLAAQGPEVAAQKTPAYFPPRLEWERRTPEQVGMDSARLEQAIAFAVSRENPDPKDLAIAHAISFGRSEPFDNLIGPTGVRAALNGVVIRHGYLVGDWGDTRKVDMTFSVTKTFLSTVVGLAWQKGLIRDVNDVVRDYMPTSELFDGPHNSRITWDHLLRRTSDWQGTLWGKPDWADRPSGEPRDWPAPPRSEPGTRYEYNDVRVNVLALAALHVWRRPLPQVLREEVMDPIGASSTWRWHGYENSWIELDGQKMQSVTGGGHWGAACSSTPMTWPASGTCSCAMAAGGTARSCRSGGSRWRGRPARRMRPTGT